MMANGMKIFGTHDDRTIAQLQRCVAAEPDALSVLCADGHVGYSMPIGGVVAYQDHVSPSGVGYDIACGNLAVQTNVMARDVPQKDLEQIANEIARQVSFGVGRTNADPVDSPVFDHIANSGIPWQANMLSLAREQLGTVGSGNHYVDILEDEAGCLWVAVHFGSRGFGWKTAKGFMNIAAGKDWDSKGGKEDMDAPPLLLRLDSTAGVRYVEAMQIAGDYAYAGREAVVDKVLKILQAEREFTVHNHHNFAWREHHMGSQFWVVRKGATPAFPGQLGFVGGSMGDISVILRGKTSDRAVAAGSEALWSTMHGAGRIMSRTQAAGKQRWSKGTWQCGQRACGWTVPRRELNRGPQGELPKCPLCDSKMHPQRAKQLEREGGGAVDFVWEQRVLETKGIILRGGGADEAPPVYRPLRDVLAAHAETIDVLHTLHPRVVVMAGANEFDPYKD